MATPVTASRIAVLPPALADQIAAGEVVERAASVVKELCENAIDAGARRIEVDIDGGGRRLVRVADDGSGMTPEEARLALRRHATSKIRCADDLWGLSTFGFRGEALPSIAAVSRLTLSTKLPGAAAGFRLTVEAGIETDAREVGIPVGTQIEVRDLFFNTPARQKFQKTEATESANVTEALLRLALGHPAIHFRLRASGRTVLDLPAHQRLGERVRAAFARRGAGALHEALGEEGGHQVHAFLATPEEASTTARSTFMFVGRRFIRDRSLLHALALGYGDLLDKGRYPLAALFLDVPGAELDVNVHPQKLEVRFARAAEVYAAVRHVVAAGVARAPWLPSARGSIRVHTLPPDVRDAVSAGGTSGGGAGSAGNRGDDGLQRAFSRMESTFPGDRRWRGSGFGPTAEPSNGSRSDEGDVGPSSIGARMLDSPSFLKDPLEPAALADGPVSSTFFQSLFYVGQLQRTYLVCEAKDELVLIDQHAAHECVAFDRLRATRGHREIPRQRLLFPLPVDVGSDVPALTPAGILTLQALGFEIDSADAVTGGRHVLLRAVPEILKDADPKPLLRDILRQLDVASPSDIASAGMSSKGIEQNIEQSIEQIMATIACHSVVRAGDVLGRPQALALLAQLDDVDLHAHRPHGRPILLRMPISEIERRFGRS